MKRLAVSIVAMLLVGCGSSETSTEQEALSGTASPPSESPAVSEEKLAVAKKEAEAGTPDEPLRDGVPPAPLGMFCRTEYCEVTRVTFARQDWPRAWRGDYQGQRNAAFCRSDGCAGAVQIDKAEGCAWRVIIIQGNSLQADSTDTGNLKVFCSQLDAADRHLAAAKARDMFQLIYDRPLKAVTVD